MVLVSRTPRRGLNGKARIRIPKYELDDTLTDPELACDVHRLGESMPYQCASQAASTPTSHVLHAQQSAITLHTSFFNGKPHWAGANDFA